MDPAEALEAALGEGKRGALVTVTEIEGAPPSRPGLSLAVVEDGSVHGTLGCDGFDRSGAADAARAIRGGEHLSGRYEWDARSRITVSVTPYAPGETIAEPRADLAELLVVGEGPVARALAGLGRAVGFRVRVAAGPGEVRRDEFASAHEIVAAPNASAVDPANVGPHTFVVICGHDEEFSQPVLRRLMRSAAPFLGMMGSRRHTGHLVAELRATGHSEDEIRRVHSPVGLDIGSETPEEIALSAIAQIVAVRRRATEPGERR